VVKSPHLEGSVQPHSPEDGACPVHSSRGKGGDAQRG